MAESIGERYMVESRYENMGDSAQSRGEPQPPLELPWEEDAELIALPAPADIQLPDRSLRAMIEQRKTVRAYSDQALTLEELAWLLWSTQGVKAKTDRPVLSRTVPSAGARHPLETYLLVNKVESLQPGLYRYISTRHALLTVNTRGDIAEKITHACLDQKHVLRSAVTFPLGRGRRPDCLALRPARLSLHAPGCRARLPEPLPGCRIHRLRGLCHRRL